MFQTTRLGDEQIAPVAALDEKRSLFIDYS